MTPNYAACRTVTEQFLLGLTVWREARGETELGRVAVAHSVLNRVARPSWWGRDLCEVLGKKWQYSSLAAPGDPQLILWPRIEDHSWLECLTVAAQVLAGAVSNPVPGADSYHDVSIGTPATMATGRYCGQIGRLRFFDLDRDFESAAIVATPRVGEPDPFIDRLNKWLAKLRATA